MICVFAEALEQAGPFLYLVNRHRGAHQLMERGKPTPLTTMVLPQTPPITSASEVLFGRVYRLHLGSFPNCLPKEKREGEDNKPY